MSNQGFCCRLDKNGTTPSSIPSQQHLLLSQPQHRVNSISPTCSRSFKAHRPSNSHRHKHRRFLHLSLLHKPQRVTSNGQSACFVSSSSLRYHQRCHRCLNSLCLSHQLRKASTFKNSYPSSALKSKYSSHPFSHRLHHPSLQSHRTWQLSYPSSMVKPCRQVRIKRQIRLMKIPSVSACAILVARTALAMKGPNELDLTCRTRNM